MTKDLKSLFGAHHGLDDKSVTFLVRALEKSNLPGFDYLEFKQSLAALMQMNMDEQTAFRSAFATASTVGLTKDKLLKTANHYKSVLQQEKTQFDQALKKQMQQRVDSKGSEIERLKKQVEDYQKKIADLQEKISKAQDTIDHADEHIQAAKEKILTAKENFDTAHQSLINDIDLDIENVNQYL